MPRHLRVAIAALTTAALISPITAAVATAGPDDGKTVATKSHVDAPKTYWQGDTFDLKTSFRDTTVGLNESVVWIGKGWGRAGQSQYQFTVPENPKMSFLGAPGDTVYSAPAVSSGNHDPVWLGFGADTDIPVDTFRDGYATLDLVSVDGPGRVDMFTWYDDPAGFRHMLSSASDGPRSALLTAGTHTHNYTTFTKPGRYALTFRTVARDTHGKLISSQLSTLAIQVGGQQPRETPTPSTQQRYEAAPAGNLTDADYTFSAAALPQPSRDGDNNLTRLSFTSKDSTLKGTLTLLIDGHFLTDLPVDNGEATWDEMLVPETSQLQAVFTPAGEGARWSSPALTVETGRESSVSSSAGEAAIMEPTQPEINTDLALEPHELVDTSFTAEITPAEEDGYTRVTLDFDDSTFRGFLRGGIYTDADSTYSDEAFEATIENGHAEFLFEDDGDLDTRQVRLIVLPHPTMNATAHTVAMEKPHEAGVKQTLRAKLERKEASTSADAPKPLTCHGAYVLDRGHVDIKATGSKDSFGLVLKDETGLIERGAHDRALSDVVLGAHDNSRQTRKGSLLLDPALDYLGKEGSEFYLLPMTQNPDVIWPGYNTQDIDYSLIDGTVDLHIEPTSAPTGGHMGMFLVKGLGNEIENLLSTKDGDTVIETAYATHTHTNWAFTKPGIYTFDTWYSAKAKNGTALTSAKQTLTIAIGDAAVKDCQNPTEPSTKPTEPSTKPSEPSTKPSEPSTKPSEPSTKPSEPSTKPTEPSTKPTEPSTKPTEPKPSEKPQPPKMPELSGEPSDVLVVLAWLMSAAFAGAVVYFLINKAPALQELIRPYLPRF